MARYEVAMEVEIVILTNADAVVKAASAGLIREKALSDIFVTNGCQGNASTGFANVGL